MIESLRVKTELLQKTKQNNKFSFLSDLSLFQHHDFQFNFKTGINLIFAQSGAGKSVLLKMLANALACEQGGSSLYTKHWINYLKDFIVFEMTRDEANELSIETDSFDYFQRFLIADVKHDGQYTYYCDPRKLRGLTHGGAAFDYDFFNDFKIDRKEHSATGKMNKSRMSDVYNILNKSVDVSTLPKEISTKNNEKWLLQEIKEKAHIQKLVEPSIPLGAKTILLDEPENALDFASQRHLFKLLKENEDRTDIQIIMITHSPLVFMLDLDKVNLILDNEEQFEAQRELIETGNFFNPNF